jgi:hypothetical protein
MHRTLGLVGAAFLLLLVGTGIVLQHPAFFRLDQRYIDSPWLLDWYGIEAPAARIFAAGNHRVARIGELTTLDGQPLALLSDDLVGATATDDFLLLLAPDALAIITRDGQLVDRLATPAAASAIGRSGDGVVIATTTGQFALSDDLLDWRALEPSADVIWSDAGVPAAGERARLIDLWRGRVISIERVLLDAHSGRIFGSVGTWLVDIGALLVLALAASGLLLARRR